jgi:hypothetical protein
MIVLSNETLQDEIAVSVAQVLASANRKAKELGVDAKESLITVYLDTSTSSAPA